MLKVKFVNYGQCNSPRWGISKSRLRTGITKNKEEREGLREERLDGKGGRREGSRWVKKVEGWVREEGGLSITDCRSILLHLGRFGGLA